MVKIQDFNSGKQKNKSLINFKLNMKDVLIFFTERQKKRKIAENRFSKYRKPT